MWTSEFLDWADPQNQMIARKMRPEKHGYEILQGTGRVKGNLLGGCLGVLKMVIGTEIWPPLNEWENKLLFLETGEDYPRPEEVCYFLNSVYTRSGQNSTPNGNATNLHSSQKRCCSFCISSSNASPTFQVQKSIFHQMTKPIQVTVILPLLLAISFSRNDDIHSSISGISNDLIGVIPTIGQ